MISEQEAREAAARLKNGGGDAFACWEDYQESSQKDEDVEVAANWICQELARREAEKAERAKPIDAEWLSTCKPDLLFWQKTSEFIEYEFRHQPQPGALKVVVNANGHVGFVVNKSLAACLTTRGQLLDLLAALRGTERPA